MKTRSTLSSWKMSFVLAAWNGPRTHLFFHVQVGLQCWACHHHSAAQMNGTTSMRLEHFDLYQKGCDRWSHFSIFAWGWRRREVLDDIDKWYILRDRVLYIVFKKRCKKKKKNPFTLERKHHSSKTIATFQRTVPILGVSKVSCLWWVHFQFQVSNTKNQIPKASSRHQISSIDGFKQHQASFLMDSRARRKRIRV